MLILNFPHRAPPPGVIDERSLDSNKTEFYYDCAAASAWVPVTTRRVGQACLSSQSIWGKRPQHETCLTGVTDGEDWASTVSPLRSASAPPQSTRSLLKLVISSSNSFSFWKVLTIPSFTWNLPEEWNLSLGSKQGWRSWCRFKVKVPMPVHFQELY